MSSYYQHILNKENTTLLDVEMLKYDEPQLEYIGYHNYGKCMKCGNGSNQEVRDKIHLSYDNDWKLVNNPDGDNAGKYMCDDCLPLRINCISCQEYVDMRVPMKTVIEEASKAGFRDLRTFKNQEEMDRYYAIVESFWKCPRCHCKPYEESYRDAQILEGYFSSGTPSWIEYRDSQKKLSNYNLDEKLERENDQSLLYEVEQEEMYGDPNDPFIDGSDVPRSGDYQ